MIAVMGGAGLSCTGLARCSDFKVGQGSSRWGREVHRRRSR